VLLIGKTGGTYNYHDFKCLKKRFKRTCSRGVIVSPGRRLRIYDFSVTDPTFFVPHIPIIHHPLNPQTLHYRISTSFYRKTETQITGTASTVLFYLSPLRSKPRCLTNTAFQETAIKCFISAVQSRSCLENFVRQNT
jgi:hypothetical protein